MKIKDKRKDKSFSKGLTEIYKLHGGDYFVMYGIICQRADNINNEINGTISVLVYRDGKCEVSKMLGTSLVKKLENVTLKIKDNE